jgi:hypothetical protein
MDQNGLSDPVSYKKIHLFKIILIIIYFELYNKKYVEVELKPKYIFNGLSCAEKKTTPVIKKTLNPIFNEVFEL